MSRNTRSCASERVARSLAAAWLAFALATTPAHAVNVGPPPLPASVVDLAPGLLAQGGGELKFFGISVYDGWYWSRARGWPNGGPYALDLLYHRNIDGAMIAQRSVDEIAKLGYGSASERTRWGELMTRIFPDVQRGDRLTGVYTRAGAVRYFHNGKPIGEIVEPGFAQAFFGIWLDPRSSRADFRQKLLGEQ